MGYEVLNDELYDKGKSKRKKRTSNSKIRFNPLYLHMLIVVGIILGLIFYFSSDLSFNFKEQKGTVTLIGNIKEFNQAYDGNLELYSDNFILKTPNGNFKDSSKDFLIENFSGNIYVENGSMNFEGKADKITYGKNSFKLTGEEFSLISMKKTTLKLFFKNINLKFENGRIKLDDTLNYQFKNSTVNFENFNSTITYDGTFSFNGKTQSFNLDSPEQNLDIIYQNDK